ncbi:hypothetical protein [Streptomyces sp. NBC_00299]|nr:hypothetical protein [Streptomyces sp. NBC_00299]
MSGDGDRDGNGESDGCKAAQDSFDHAPLIAALNEGVISDFPEAPPV